MRRLLPALLTALCLTGAAGAQTDPVLPALHDVTGVAGDDVLNLRAGPDAAAPILGTIPPDRTALEVVGFSPDGRWARIGLPEVTGWVAARYLAPQPPRPADSLPVPMSCYGTEPFWMLRLPAEGGAEYEGMAERFTPYDITWQGLPDGGGASDVAAELSGEAGSGVVLVRRERCSDGMSDREFGISLRLVLTGAGGTVYRAGCCQLTGN